MIVLMMYNCRSLFQSQEPLLAIAVQDFTQYFFPDRYTSGKFNEEKYSNKAMFILNPVLDSLMVNSRVFISSVC